MPHIIAEIYSNGFKTGMMRTNDWTELLQRDHDVI
jgi:hypothetical protein